MAGTSDKPLDEQGTVVIPVHPVVRTMYIVYPAEQQSPSQEELATTIDRYSSEHLPSPLSDVAATYRRSELFSTKTVLATQLPQPPLSLLRYGGMLEAQEQTIRSANHAVVLHGHDLNHAPRAGLWASLAAALAVQRLLGGVVFDPDAPRLLAPDSSERWFTWNGVIAAAHHIIVPFSIGHRGLGWITTNGLGKFGLPDVEIRDVPPNLTSMHMLISTVAQALIERALLEVQEKSTGAPTLSIPEKLTIDRRLLSRAHSEQSRETTDDVSVQIGLEFHAAARESKQPMIRLVPPRSFGKDTGVWLSLALGQLVGSEHEIRMARTQGDAMQQAHQRAVRELPTVKARFQAGLALGEVLYVKHGFPTAAQSTEYMWLAVNRWEGTRLVGQLANEPHNNPTTLRLGQTVSLDERDVFDWMIQSSEGREEGGYTTRVALEEGQP